MLKFSVTRTNRADTVLGGLLPRMKQRVDPAIRALGASILVDSLNRVPKDTTALAMSAGMRTEDLGFTFTATVGYGRKDLYFLGIHSPHEGKRVDRHPYDYAVLVHEVGTSSGLGGVAGQYSGEAEFLRTPASNIQWLRSILYASLAGRWQAGGDANSMVITMTPTLAG